MIWESFPWKYDIGQHSRYLKARSLQKRQLSEAQHINVEKRIMIAFYAIRKLIEARKLSDDCTSPSIPLKEHPRIASTITHLNWHHLDRHFDFSHPRVSQWKLIDLCHQVVHSHIFAVYRSENSALSGIYLASDRQKRVGLLEISIVQIVEIFDLVASDDVSEMIYRRDPESGREKFRLKK